MPPTPTTSDITVPKSLAPPTSYTTHTLRSTLHLLHLFHARNRNQHSRASWYRHLAIFRREVRRLAYELQIDISRTRLSGERNAPERGLKRVERCRRLVGERLQFWKSAGLVEKWYCAFTHLVAAKQFAPQGLLLLALLARVSSITGFTRMYKEMAEREEEERQEAVRRVLREFGEREGRDLGVGVRVGDVVVGGVDDGDGDIGEAFEKRNGEDLGEVVERDG